MTSTGIEIRPAAQSEIPAVAAVLARAFSTDPFTLAMLAHPDDPDGLLRVLFAGIVRRHYLPRGAVDVAWRGDRLVGAALWAGPGSLDLDTRTGLAVFRDIAPALRLRLAPVLLQEFRARRVHPKAPHWYLYAIGVAETGHGVGGRLLDHGLRRAGDVPSYLEASTPDSARLYERKGFRRIGELPTPRGVSPLPQMWHETPPV